MTTYNTLRLVRTLRRERDRKIVYENQVVSWEKIFELHPLKSKKNTSHFYEMEHCKEYLGGNTDSILVLRSGYTWGLLRKIAQNSPKDCETFKEVALKTMKDKSGILQSSIPKFFNKTLTALSLGLEKCPKTMDKWHEHDLEAKEIIVKISLQYYGLAAYQKLCKKGYDKEISNLKEKCLLWFWHSDATEINKFSEILDTFENKFDIDYIADNLRANQLLNKKAIDINEKYLAWNKISVKSERYEVDSSIKSFPLSIGQQEKTPIDEIMSVLVFQKIMLNLEKINKTDGYKENFIPQCKYWDTKTYTNVVDILQAWPCNKKWQQVSIEKFINSKIEELNKIPVQTWQIDFWTNNKVLYQKYMLKESLEDNLITNETKTIKPKI